MGLFFAWSSAFAENNGPNLHQWRAQKSLENPAGRRIEGLLVAGNYDVKKSTSTGNYDVNKSTSTSGNYDVNKSSATSQGSKQNTTSNKTKTDTTSDYTKQQEAIKKRVESSPKYKVPFISGRGSYAQGK
jgi:hypothetical protein